MLIYYLPHITLACYDGTKSTNDLYELTINIVYIDLTKDYTGTTTPFGSFFHEIGHGIDDLTNPDPLLNSSEDFYKSIKDDFKESLEVNLEKYNTDPNTLHMTDEELKEVEKYILGIENNNVLADKNYKDIYINRLPDHWTKAQRQAYDYIRSQYGYCNVYINGEGKAVVEVAAGGDPKYGDSVTGTLNGDMFGAVTNNKVGLTPCGHYAPYLNAWLPFSDPVYNAALLQAEMDTFPYWRINKLYGMEFFAEAFKYGAQNIDTTASKEVFDGTYEIFEKKMQEIYDGVPHYDI